MAARNPRVHRGAALGSAGLLGRTVGRGQGQTKQACQHAEAAWQLPALTPRDEHDLRRLYRVLMASGSLQAGLVAREARQLGVDIESSLLKPRAASVTLKPALPAEVTPFVGQRETLRQLGEWLADPDIRLLTILGAGGAGKTRLALQVARQARPNFQGRVWWVPLEDLSHPDELYAHLALALGTPLSPGMSALDSLANVLAERSALLVLDQVEHLEGAAPLVADLLGRYPDLKVLVTSRHRLLLRAEVTFELRGLEVAALTAEAHSDALTLFLQQARRVRPSYPLSHADLKDAQELCVLVDGMPLAIELIANWMRMLTPGQMLTEMYGGVDASALSLDAVSAARQTGDNFTLMIALYIREYAAQQRGDPGRAALLAEMVEAQMQAGDPQAAQQSPTDAHELGQGLGAVLPSFLTQMVVNTDL